MVFGNKTSHHLKLFFYFFLIFQLNFLSCAKASFSNIKIEFKSIERKVNDSTKILLIKDISINTQLNENFPFLIKSTIEALQNTNVFKGVYYKEAPPLANPKQYLYISEIKFFVFDQGNFDWKWSWPAIWPMPLYYPIQVKKGNVKFIAIIKIHQSAQENIEIKFERDKLYEIFFYGFFRKKPIEDAMVKSCLEILNEWGKIKQIDLDKKTKGYGYWF